MFCGQLQRFAATQYPELFTILVNNPKLWCPNLCIQARTSADYESPLYFSSLDCNRLWNRGQRRMSVALLIVVLMWSVLECLGNVFRSDTVGVI